MAWVAATPGHKRSIAWPGRGSPQVPDEGPGWRWSLPTQTPLRKTVRGDSSVLQNSFQSRRLVSKEYLSSFFSARAKSSSKSLSYNEVNPWEERQWASSWLYCTLGPSIKASVIQSYNIQGVPNRFPHRITVLKVAAAQTAATSNTRILLVTYFWGQPS